MQPSDLIEATTKAIHDVPAAFMVDMATYARGADLGFAGADYYFAGRGGVLGETSGAVVAAAFVFFAPETVIEAWDRSAGVESRADAAAHFAETGHEWARAHLTGDEVVAAAATVASLATRIIDASDASAAPLFAGWRSLAVPDDAVAAAHHQLNALRELRGALHGGAIRCVGMSPSEAVLLADPRMAPIHGFSPDTPVDESRRGLLAEAEALTNAAVTDAFATLNEAEADAFAAACAVLHGAL